MKAGVFLSKKKEKITGLSKLKIGVAAVCAIAAIGVFTSGKESNTIKESPAIVQQTIEKETPFSESQQNITTDNDSDVVYVGSLGSDKYHIQTCRWAKEIKEQNVVYFESIDQAKSKGYSPCGTCKPK